MPGYVPERLRPLVGPDLDSVTVASLERLIGIAESDVFDIKQATYGNGDSDKRELTADVCSFANNLGGLIIIGMTEDGLSNANGIAPLADVSGEELRIRQIVTRNAAPVPTFDTRTVSASDGHLILIGIPPSVGRPHAVVKDDDLRFPVRQGSRKRYLAESEVADIYRSRFAVARDQLAEAEAKFEDLFENVDRERKAWLVVGIHPSHPARVSPTRELVEQTRSFLNESMHSFASWHIDSLHARPAFRAVAFSDMHDGGTYLRQGMLHLDGSAVVAVGSHRQTDDFQGHPTGPVRFADEDIVCTLMNVVTTTSRWANQCGARGDAVLLAQMISPWDSTSTLGIPEELPMAVDQYRGDVRGILRDSMAVVGETGRSELTVSLAALQSSGADLVAVVRQAAEDLLSSFGHLGPMQLTAEGTVIRKFFYRDRQAEIRRWCEAHQVVFVED